MADLNLPPNVKLDPNTGLYRITNAQGKTVRVSADTQDQLNQYVKSVDTGVPATVTVTDPNTGNPRTQTFDSAKIISQTDSINQQNALLTAGKRQAGVIGNSDGSYQDIRTGKTISQGEAAAKIQAAGLPPETLQAVTPKNAPSYQAAQNSIDSTTNTPSNIPAAAATAPSQADAGNGSGPAVDASVPAAPAPVTPTESVASVSPGQVPVQGTINQNFIDANSPVGVGEEDPFEAARLAAEERANADAADITLTPDEQAAADDPFEARRLELEQEANRQELAEQATDVEPTEDPFETARLAAEERANADPADITLTPDEQAAADDPFEARRLELEQEANRQELAEQATDVEPGLFNGQTDEFGGVDEAIAARQAENVGDQDPANATRADQNVINANDPQGSGDEEAVNKWKATQQATLQSRLNQPSSADWRVRLSLGPGSNYLYNAPSAQGKNSTDILAPLFRTNGVIFPYTPTIETSYQAKYQTSDLTHSNYRGYFYQNSYVNDVNVRGVFTAQDTKEAEYLLATIHFFRSVTKMFYGKDAEAGTPPPLVFLSGFGQFQYNNHPCLVTAFNYSLPSDVDYIRANGFNNFGLNLENRRNQSSGPAPGGGLGGVFGAISRLTNSGLAGGSLTQTPSPSNVNQQVNNTNPTNSTYVPTKMEISITLLPVQSRKQISQQFSLKSFASGDLLKGGFW